MSTFVGIPPFSDPLWVAIETMHFHIAYNKNKISGIVPDNSRIAQGVFNWFYYVKQSAADTILRFKILNFMRLIVNNSSAFHFVRKKGNIKTYCPTEHMKG